MLPAEPRNYKRFLTKENTHFVEPSFRAPKPVFLGENVYSQVLDNIVFACVDCAVVNHNQTKILLGFRSYPPQPDWWVIGGRIRPGESFKKAAKRNIQRELGLDLPKKRFGKIIGVFSTVWGERRQFPQGNGSHSINTTLILRLNKSEIERIKKNNEYKELNWFSISTLSRNPRDARGFPKFHPALVTMAKKIPKKTAEQIVIQKVGELAKWKKGEADRITSDYQCEACRFEKNPNKFCTGCVHGDGNLANHW